MNWNRIPRFAFLLAVAACFLASGCGGNKRVTKANFDQIKEGMPKAEVEAILGPGEADTGVGLTEGSSVAGAVGIGDMSTVSRPSGPVWMKWGDDKKYIKIRFAGDRVEKGQIQQKGL
jgi:hypothetical protein